MKQRLSFGNATDEEYLARYYNPVFNMTARCRLTEDYKGRYPELEPGRRYTVTHICVLRSSSYVILEGLDGEYNPCLFDIFEDGLLSTRYVRNSNYWAPYLRELYQEHHDRLPLFDIKYKVIPAFLRRIEEEHHVRILLAVESGSRAWGFESPDSDWDVRFIYVHVSEWYMSLDEQRDVIEAVDPEHDIDASGWDLRKALRLFRKGNPSIFEWLHSSSIYGAYRPFLERMLKLEPRYADSLGLMYHYYSWYNRTNERYLDCTDVPLKKFLYYLRGILCCHWVMRKRTVPPVSFPRLAEAIVEEEPIRRQIKDLVLLKRSGGEATVAAVPPELMAYARAEAAYFEERLEAMTDDYKRLLEPDYDRSSSDSCDLDRLLILMAGTAFANESLFKTNDEK